MVRQTKTVTGIELHANFRCEERFTKILYTRFVTFQHTYLALADFLDSGSRYNYQFARFKLVNIRITRTLIFVSSNPSGHSSKRHLFWLIQDYPCMTELRFSLSIKIHLHFQTNKNNSILKSTAVCLWNVFLVFLVDYVSYISSN